MKADLKMEYGWESGTHMMAQYRLKRERERTGAYGEVTWTVRCKFDD